MTTAIKPAKKPGRAKITINKAVARANVFIYRVSGGKFLGKFGELPALLLTTTGAKTGKIRTNPVGYVRDGERFVITAVYGGEPVNPSWYWNLKATPTASIEVGRERYRVKAEILEPGPERDRIWTYMVDVFPLFAKFQKKTDRLVPVIVLTPA